MATPTSAAKRNKVSPGGVITLPVAARRALGMMPGQGARVTVAVEAERVVLAPAGDQGGFRVSPKGQMELRGEARALVESNGDRHFALDYDDDERVVRLYPSA